MFISRSCKETRWLKPWKALSSPKSFSKAFLKARWWWWGVFHIQFSSVAQSCPTLCSPMDCSTPGLLVHHQLPKLPQTHIHPVGDAIQPSHPLSSPSPAFNLSQNQGLFQCVSSSHQVAKVLGGISPSNEYSVLISFRIDWFDLLAVQGTLKSLLQYHSSKASILQCSAFFLIFKNLFILIGG